MSSASGQTRTRATSSTPATPIPSYILSTLPSAAVPIIRPSPSASTLTSKTGETGSSSAAASSFPPSVPSTVPNGGGAASSSKVKLPLSNLSSNVSDLLLSSLLPPNLPKLPTQATSGANTAATADPSTTGQYGGGRGIPRELSSQREALSLPLVSNNFRRFVTRVGPLFYLQDRVEEVLFWRKPTWTWAWLITWTFICIITPSSSATDRIYPSTSGSSSTASANTSSQSQTQIQPQGRRDSSPTASTRAGGELTVAAGQAGYTATTTRDSEGETVAVPAVPPKEAESGVDYYMNLQAIQNLMGLVSDAYDQIAPRLAALQSPSTPSPTSLPITPTHLILLLLPPTILLPLTPLHLIPYLLLPLGLVPPLLFHPNLPSNALFNLPRNPTVLKFRAYVESFLLNDNLSDSLGRKEIDRVEVWENERLEPKIATSLTSASATGASGVLANLPTTAWSAKHLRPSDRPPWVKVVSPSPPLSFFQSQGRSQSAKSSSLEESKWKSTDDTVPLTSTSSGTEKERERERERETGETKTNVLALKDGWDWIPGEDWRVDVCGLWSEMGVDDDGWIYSDDSWQNPAPTPITEADSPSTAPGNGGMGGGGTMPGLALRRVTRRRRWWRRVYELAESV